MSLFYYTKQTPGAGFDALGFPLEYSSAADAGCALEMNQVDHNTVLYIPMYGPAPFTDLSYNGFTVTNNGVTAVTDVKPVRSLGSGYFTAANQYLYLSYNVLSGLTQFTLQFDYRFSSIPSSNGWSPAYYFAANGPNQGAAGTDMRFGKTQIEVNLLQDSGMVSTPYTPDTGVWHHFKITRASNYLVTVYIDKQALKSYTDGNNLYSNQSYGFVIGRAQPKGQIGTGFRGYMANYKISDIVR